MYLFIKQFIFTRFRNRAEQTLHLTGWPYELSKHSPAQADRAGIKVEDK